eukprot:6214358-Pleurochrysis_carterae.AAC.4
MARQQSVLCIDAHRTRNTFVKHNKAQYARVAYPNARWVASCLAFYASAMLTNVVSNSVPAGAQVHCHWALNVVTDIESDRLRLVYVLLR